MASSIFIDMSGGWDSTCGGGIWWSKDKTYKNAIANELFLSVAAHLANRVAPTERGSYLAWANREWTWFQQCGMINSQNLINDGLDLSTCKNNGQNTWTYNQGVILGGLVELDRAQRSPQLLSTAHTIADAAITHLSDSNGVITIFGEANPVVRTACSLRASSSVTDGAGNVADARSRNEQAGCPRLPMRRASGIIRVIPAMPSAKCGPGRSTLRTLEARAQRSTPLSRRMPVLRKYSTERPYRLSNRALAMPGAPLG